jgi:hypothetical protein
MAVNDNVLAEHGIRSNPQATVTIKRLINNDRLESLAVPSNGHHLIVVALVVPVTAES